MLWPGKSSNPDEHEGMSTGMEGSILGREGSMSKVAGRKSAWHFLGHHKSQCVWARWVRIRGNGHEEQSRVRL